MKPYRKPIFAPTPRLISLSSPNFRVVMARPTCSSPPKATAKQASSVQKWIMSNCRERRTQDRAIQGPRFA